MHHHGRLKMKILKQRRAKIGQTKKWKWIQSQRNLLKNWSYCKVHAHSLWPCRNRLPFSESGPTLGSIQQEKDALCVEREHATQLALHLHATPRASRTVSPRDDQELLFVSVELFAITITDPRHLFLIFSSSFFSLFFSSALPNIKFISIFLIFQKITHLNRLYYS